MAGSTCKKKTKSSVNFTGVESNGKINKSMVLTALSAFETSYRISCHMRLPEELYTVQLTRIYFIRS